MGIRSRRWGKVAGWALAAILLAGTTHMACVTAQPTTPGFTAYDYAEMDEGHEKAVRHWNSADEIRSRHDVRCSFPGVSRRAR